MIERIEGILRAQGGAGSAQQLRAAGVSPHTITELVRAKVLQRVRRDAVVLVAVLQGATPWDRAAVIARAVGHELASAVHLTPAPGHPAAPAPSTPGGAQAAAPHVHALSHQSALMIHGLPWFGDTEVVHLCRTDGVRGRRGKAIFVHQPVGPEWVVEVDGLRVLTPVLAALQVAATAGVEAGLVCLDGVLHRARTRDQEECGTTDGPHTRAARQQIDRARQAGFPHAEHDVATVVGLADGRSESAGESRARWALLQLGFGPVDPQFEVVVGGRLLGRADLRLRRWKVLVEFDGQGKYGHLSDLFAEKRREDAIRAQGYILVRLTWADLASPERLRRKVLDAIALVAAA